MNTFRKGDRINVTGRTGTFMVTRTNGPLVYYDYTCDHYENCTLANGSKFKAGDRVLNRSGDLNTIKCVKTTWNDGNKYDSYPAYDNVGRGWDLESSLTLAPSVEDLIKAGKKIDAIREYRAIHGVGLLEGKNAVEAIAAKMAAPKFKVGDRVESSYGNAVVVKSLPNGYVEVKYDDGQVYSYLGTCSNHESFYTLAIASAATGGFFAPGDVVSSNTRFGKFTVKFRDGSYTYFEGGGYELTSNLSLVKAAEPISIVALIKNGQPRSNERPHVHATKDSATKEARRLADANPGVDFGVFTLTSISTAPPPVVTPATTRVV